MLSAFSSGRKPQIYFKSIFIVRVSTNQMGNKVRTQLWRRKRHFPIPKASRNKQARKQQGRTIKDNSQLVKYFHFFAIPDLSGWYLYVDESRC